MKKGFAVNQLFVYATSLIVISLVLYFGVKSVGVFNSRSCEIQMADFISSLETRVNEVSSDYGSMKRIDLSLPCSATKICIADFSGETSSITRILSDEASPLAASAYESGVENVFLLEDQRVIASLKVDGISVVNPGVLCSDNDRTSLRMRGVGRVAEISLWEAAQ